VKLKFFIAVPVLIVGFTTLKVYELKPPSYFPKPNYDLKNNPLTQDKINLGKVLFYDPILSKDNTISCASCHSSYQAFAHTDHQLSHGINDLIGTRNAPALFNLAWQNTFMWDGAVNHLDVQALAPIAHEKEMAEKIDNVVNKLQHTKLYPQLFKKAFNDTIISGERVLKALSQFQLTLISSTTKYDRVKQNKTKFTGQEQKGYEIFLANCNACHTEPLFSNYTFANNGLPVDTTLKDMGRYTITKNSTDSLKFKIPSLRNISYTSPYMHDGRFNKINQVLNHYLSGIKQSPTLAPELRKPIQLTPDQKTDLTAFLLTLNDSAFVFNPQHQYPKQILKPGEGNRK
jgi:cytochrome c peroxidase